MVRLDRIKKKIEEKKPVIGTHVRWTDSSVAEILAISGYDYIWIDGEHGAMSIETINNHLRAIQPYGTAAFVRVPWNDPVLVKPYLEMGVDGIIFPWILTKEDAEKAVASCCYPPVGIRGFGPGRGNLYGFMNIDEYLEEAKQIWKIIQIEHITAVENLDEILSVKGIDAVIVGMQDLSGSMGILTKIKQPELKAQCDFIGEKCKAAGIPFGVSMFYDEEIVADWFRRGASLMTSGGDQDFICGGARANLKDVNALFDAAPK